jgi:pimeloyl-ACP methyl ester carboxylesterase
MLPDRLRIVYLHGFASTPGSRKAMFFSEKLRSAGLTLEVPDLAAGDFEHLTISGQLAVIEQSLRDEPCVLIGSSLGGYLAALYASRHPSVRRILLLAPAFDFYQLWANELGPERLSQWRESGTLPVFHYGEGHDVPLRFDFISDAQKYEPFSNVPQPALIFHGTSDNVVPVQTSVRFVDAHPNATLVTVRSGHELTDALDEIWLKAQDFLSLTPDF